MPAPVLDGLDPEQRLVAEALNGPVVVLAGAGTGKTRAITHRIAHAVQTGTHAAGNGLAVTFTNRAAGEMRQRLAGLGVPAVSVRTFHAAALSQLRYFWPTAVGGQFPDLVASKAVLVGQACREIGIPSGRPLVRDLATEIEWAGSTMVSAGDYATAAAAAGRTPVGAGETVIDLPGVARVISAYQDVKSRAGAIDFEDVLLAMIALIGDRPDIADAIRAQYRWFTVDEYQDITPAQDRLLSGWLGDRDDVCVVGDASQTIYSFAGASPDALGQFARRWPNATEVRLDRCYRCTPEIVAVANSVIRGARADGRGSAGAGSPAASTGSGSRVPGRGREPSLPPTPRPLPVRGRPCGCGRSAPPVHLPRSCRAPTTPRRPRPWPPGSLRWSPGATPIATSRSSCGPTRPQSRSRSRSRRRTSPTSCAALNASSTVRRSARRSSGCGVTPWPVAAGASPPPPSVQPRAGQVRRPRPLPRLPRRPAHPRRPARPHPPHRPAPRSGWPPASPCRVRRSSMWRSPDGPPGPRWIRTTVSCSRRTRCSPAWGGSRPVRPAGERPASAGSPLPRSWRWRRRSPPRDAARWRSWSRSSNGAHSSRTPRQPTG